MKKLRLQAINHSEAKKAGVSLYMARADILHSLASGNKFYKLAPNLEYAKRRGYKQLLSFGGAYSNHLHALALSAKAQGFDSIGIVRGEPQYASNTTLQDVQAAGMKLQFVSREEYRRRSDPDYLQSLQQQFPDALIIPEGGSSQIAIAGCAQLANDINAIQTSNVLTVACGTGATLAGIVCGLQDGQRAIGYVALKDQSLPDRLQTFLEKESCADKQYSLKAADYGGFAKLDKDLLDFIFEWLEITGILLDPIYTSKMCRCLIEQINSGDFSQGTSITLIHSGGLQGWRGMKQKVIHYGGEKGWRTIKQALDII